MKVVALCECVSGTRWPKHFVSIATRWQFFKTKLQELWGLEDKARDYSQTITVTWNITINRVKEKYPAVEDLLGGMSCLASTPNKIHEGWLSELVRDEQIRISSLGELAAYSMIEKHHEQNNFLVHSLVQETIFDSLSTERRRKYLPAITSILQKLYPYKLDLQLANYTQQRNLLPHLEKSLSRVNEWLTDLEKSKLSNSCDASLRESIEKELLLPLLVLLADGHENLGDARKKKDLLKQALPIQKKYYEEADQNIMLESLGNAYGALGNARKQKELLERVLLISEKQYGDTHPEVAITLNNLALAYGALGNNDKKKKLLERALLIQEKHFEDVHSSIAITLGNLATAYGALGDFHKKKELLERALPIQEKHYGNVHPNVAITLANLGNAYGDLGDARKKKELLERALMIKEGHYGQDHPEVARTLGNLANAYGDLGDANKKKELLQRVLMIEEPYYGYEHPEVAKTLGNLANAYGVLGDAYKKKELLKRTLLIQEKHYGDVHPEVARTLVNLANAHSALGDVYQQEKLLKRALSIVEKYYGDTHPEFAITLESLANAYIALDDAFKSKELLKRVLSIKEKHYGIAHFEVARTVRNLGNAYGALGNARKQKELLERALFFQEKYYGVFHPQVAMTLHNLAAAYFELNQLIEAKTKAESAYKIFLAHPDAGPKHPHTQQAKQKLDAITQIFSVLMLKQAMVTAASQPSSLSVQKQADTEKALRNAANQNSAELLSQLIKETKELNINAQDNGQHQRSALHWAVVKEAILCIKSLLKAGANIYLVDKAGKSALDYGFESKQLTVLGLLITHKYKLPVEEEIDFGKLLRRTAHEGDAKILEMLLEKIPQIINVKDNGKTERTALHWSVIKGHVECVKLLLASGADTKLEDKDKKSAIDYAKQLNNSEIQQALAMSKQLNNAAASAASAAVPNTFFQQSSSTQAKADQDNTEQKKLGK